MNTRGMTTVNMNWNNALDDCITITCNGLTELKIIETKRPFVLSFDFKNGKWAERGTQKTNTRNDPNTRLIRISLWSNGIETDQM